MKGGFDMMDLMQSQSFDSKSSALVCRAGLKWNLLSLLVHGVLPSPKYQGTASFSSTKQSTMFHVSQWYLSQYQVGCLVQVQAVGWAANLGGRNAQSSKACSNTSDEGILLADAFKAIHSPAIIGSHPDVSTFPSPSVYRYSMIISSCNQA